MVGPGFARGLLRQAAAVNDKQCFPHAELDVAPQHPPGGDGVATANRGEDACVVVPERSVEGPAPQEAGVGAAIARMLGYLARTRFIATRFPWLAGPGGAAAVKFATDPSRAALIQRLVASDGSLRVSKTVAQQLTTSRIYIPNQSILDVVGSGVRLPDPQGVAGQFMYRAQASFNGSLGQLEVLVNEHLGVINHVLYKSIK